jgi:transposase-like protein
MSMINVSKVYSTREACLDKLEQLRWPNGKICCIKCGLYEDEKGKPAVTKFVTAPTIRKKTGKVIPSRRLYQCKGCGYQFSVTEGTVFHRSHISLEKWFIAVSLILEAKKGISSLQVGRNLGVSEKNTKSTWYLCHRIREAAIETGLLHGIVEADETFLHPRKPRKGNPKVKNPNRMAVLGMIQRGGKLKLIPIKDAKLESIKKPLLDNVKRNAILQTDTTFAHGIMGRVYFPKHRMINHIVSYGEGENHTNGVENAFSLLKRGIYGTYHQVSIKHLGRYCEEFSWRFNQRDRQKYMFDETLKRLVNMKPLPFKELTASEESAEL